MAWQSYSLDQKAHDLVLKYRDKDVLNQSHKMRSTVAFGLERFWGEQLRLERDDINKANYWKDVWQELVNIMRQAGVNLPNDSVNPSDTNSIQKMSKKLWEFDQKQRKVALAVLTQLCDSLIWWTQRYKK